MQILERNAEVAHIGLGGRDDPRLAALFLGHDVAHAHVVVGAEAQLELFPRRQLRQLAVADEGAIAEQGDLAWQHRRAPRNRDLGVEVGLLIALRHRAHHQGRIELGHVDLYALGLPGRRHRDEATDAIDGLDGLALDRAFGFLRRNGRGALRLRLVQALLVVGRDAAHRLALHQRARQASDGCRRRARRVGFIVDQYLFKFGRGRAGPGPRRGERQADVVPALPALLLYAGPAYRLQLRRQRLVPGRKARLVEGEPRVVGDLIVDGEVSLERAGGVDEDLELGSLVLRGSNRGKLSLQFLDLALDLTHFDLRIEDRLLRLAAALADQHKELAPIGLGGRRCAARQRPRRQLGQVIDQGSLRLGRFDAALQGALFIAQLFDGIFNAFAFAGGDRAVAARHEHAAAVDRADLELAARLGLDADRARKRPRRQVGEQDGVIAGLERYLAQPRHLGTGRKNHDGGDPRRRRNLGGPRGRARHEDCEDYRSQQHALSPAHCAR